ncbi:MAG: hypothetical protein Q9170_003903 [Blastenia crenularia]
MDNLAEDSEIGSSNTPDTDHPCAYKCTGCRKSFRSMQAWSRHEKEDHEDINFPCMPNGPIEITLRGRECALCGQQPTKEHLENHHIERCIQLKHVFKRSYELKQHLETHGLVKKSRQSDVLVSKWQQVPNKKAWACGFCKGLFTSLAEFHKHIAAQHYEQDETREWDHTKVILGLLSQPHVSDPWKLLLASRFKVEFLSFTYLSCKWKKSNTGRLQFRLELGEETGESLAQAALDCAIYDHSLLHETFRCVEGSNPDPDIVFLTDALGPPVPPKPLPLRPPHQDHSQLKTYTAERKTAESLSSDQFKTPSPPLFDASISADHHSDRPKSPFRGFSNDFSKTTEGDLVNPADISMDRSIEFLPHQWLHWEDAPNTYYTGADMRL